MEKQSALFVMYGKVKTKYISYIQRYRKRKDGYSRINFEIKVEYSSKAQLL